MKCTLFLATMAAMGAMLLADPGEVSAAPACEHRSAAHIAEHGGLKADSAWHVARGERPTCDSAKPAQRSSEPRESASKGKGSNDDDRKSRYCRKRWWC